MTKIPDTVSLLNALGGSFKDPQVIALRNLLIGVLLTNMNEDVEALVLKNDDVRRADRFSLVVTDLQDEDAVILTVRPK